METPPKLFTKFNTIEPSVEIELPNGTFVRTGDCIKSISLPIGVFQIVSICATIRFNNTISNHLKAVKIDGTSNIEYEQFLNIYKDSDFHPDLTKVSKEYVDKYIKEQILNN